MNRPFYVIKQQADKDLEYSATVVDRFDFEEDATKLIQALKIAHDLELKAGHKYKVKYNFFSLFRSE